MKKLGLIGGTGPQSTIMYYQKLTSQYAKKHDSRTFPAINIESLDVYQVLNYCKKKDLNGLTTYLLKGFDILAKADCDFAALTGVTPHMVIDRLQKQASLPIISMLDVTAEYLNKRHKDKVLLLGTKSTMSNEFVKNTFIKKGITTIVPNPEQQDFIENKIENELELGTIKEKTVNQFKKICLQYLPKEEIQAVIIGCTELPLAFRLIKLPVEQVDMMQLHIKKLLELLN